MDQLPIIPGEFKKWRCQQDKKSIFSNAKTMAKTEWNY